jgi:Putative transposase/Transposase zinc-binding domain
MRDSFQAQGCPADSLCGRPSTQRSNQSQTPGYRFGADAAQDYPGQGKQRPLCSNLTPITLGTSSLLANKSTDDLSIPRQDRRRATLGSHHSEGLQASHRDSRYQETGHTTYPSTFFRDRATRSRGRSHGHQQALRAQQFYDYDDLFALSEAALRFDPQPDRLATSSTMPQVGRSVTPESQFQGTAPQLATGSHTHVDRSKLTVASIIKHFTPGFIAKHRANTAAHVESTLARIGFCRTAFMGGRTYECRTCNTKISLYNSCADRHCPQCSGARRSDWLAKAAELVLEGVTYFQVVFTLPDKLSSLILGNRVELYRLLMQVAAASLKYQVESELGMQSASLMVLHTWNQRLEHHPHVHALVPGSGPSLDGQRWIDCKRRKGKGNKFGRPYLVDNKALSQAFSQRFIRKLKSLHRNGALKLEGTCQHLSDSTTWKHFLKSLLDHDWCVFIQPPPRADSSPDHVLKYLARYMTGGPISDSRLVRCEDDNVTFMARSKDKNIKKPVAESLSGVVFTRRWAMHILPKGFTRTRCYGGFSSRYRTAFVALCNQLRPHQPSVELEDERSVEANATETDDTPCCPQCKQKMAETLRTQRPSWRVLFYGPDHHAWYES